MLYDVIRDPPVGPYNCNKAQARARDEPESKVSGLESAEMYPHFVVVKGRQHGEDVALLVGPRIV